MKGTTRPRIRALLIALAVFLATVVPAFSASNYKSKASGKAIFAPLGSTDSEEDSQPDPSGDESDSSGNSQVVEEEQHSKILGLSPGGFHLRHGIHFESERIDHAYEAWFYYISHPPLTPPPNRA